MGYICYKCGMATMAESLIASNRVYRNADDMKLWLEKNERYGNYYEDENNYYITWICANCNLINLHHSRDKNPISIIPNYDFGIILVKLSKCENENLIILFNEFIKCFTLKLNSVAILLGRKILIHLSIVETNCKENEKFVYYIDELMSSGILGNKWNAKLNIIRKLGNDENHQIKICSNEDLETVKDIIIGLIENIYI